MSVRLEIDAFFACLYRDAHVKNRIIVWTFVGLVFPTALLLALGVPSKPLYTAMFLLLLPLQFVVYRFSGHRVYPEGITQGAVRVNSIRRTEPNIEASWVLVLNTGKRGDVHQVFFDANVLPWRESLQGDARHEEAQSASSLDPQLRAMLGKPVPQPVRMSIPFCFNP
jgi:hypothetical protein